MDANLELLSATEVINNENAVVMNEIDLGTVACCSTEY
jgi:hypothetical protein